MDSIPTDKRADKQPSVASKFRSGKVKGDIYLKGQVRYLQHGLLTIFFPPMDSLASGPTAIEIPGYVNVLSIPHSVASPSPAVKTSEQEPLTTIGLFNSVWSKVWGQVINPLPKINWEHKLDTFREPFHCSNFKLCARWICWDPWIPLIPMEEILRQQQLEFISRNSQYKLVTSSHSEDLAEMTT